MAEKDPTALQEDPAPSADHADAKLLVRGECDTVIVDSQGRICGCGAGAESQFGASRSRLIGRQISEFIARIFCDEASSTYNAGDLVRLCAAGDWRKFDAKDTDGRGFAIEIHVSRRMADRQEVFVLNLRQPEATS